MKNPRVRVASSAQASINVWMMEAKRAGSDAYPGVIYEKLKSAYEILDKTVLLYHLHVDAFSAKSGFYAQITA
jgi:hypothetical protein